VADYAGLKKYLKNYKGTSFDRTAAARKFGYKDKDVVYRAVKEIGREDLLELPFRKGAAKALEYLKKQPKGSSIQVHQLAKKLNVDDGTIIRALEQLPEKKFIRSKFKPSVLTNEEFTKLYKDKKMSDPEFADYLNNKIKKTTSTGTKFNDKTVQATRKRLNLKSRHPNPVIAEASDLFIKNEAKRLNVNTTGLTKEELRKKVLSRRGDEQRNLKMATDADFLERRRELRRRTMENIKADPKRLAAYKKKLAEYGSKRMWGLVPVEKTPKGLFWRDLVENALRFKNNQLPNSHIQFLNSKEKRPTSISSAKNVKLIDINVLDKNGKPKVLTYDNFLKHADDNSTKYGMSSKDLLKEYDKKRFIQQDPKLRDLLNKKIYKRYDPTNFTNRSVFSPFHIHHPAGRARNAFNVQLGVGSENMAENALRTKFKKNFDIAKTLTEKKDAMKNYITNVSDNLEVRIKNVPYGKRETFEKMITRVGGEKSLTNEQRGAIKLYDSASQKGKDFLEARIGCSKGCFIKTVKEEPYKLANLIDTGQITTADKVPQPEKSILRDEFKEANVRWNNDVGAFETPNGNVATQEDLKLYAEENPMEVKVGTEPPTPNKSVLKTVGKTLARVGAPLPTALIDGYFINKQMDEGKSTAEIAKDPLNWIGLAAMEPLSKVSGVAEKGGMNAVLRLGLNPATIRGISRFAGLPGLAISTAMTAYDQYKKYQNEEGFVYNLFNKEGN
jgi:DNA-binding transcriptional regulator YhcF (GntR family)